MQLAQVNVARMKAPLDSAEMSDFVARIAEINALADASPGFVWRFATDQGNVIREVMRRRHRWFAKFEAAYLALWWIPAGHVPSIRRGEGPPRAARSRRAEPRGLHLQPGVLTSLDGSSAKGARGPRSLASLG
jgi:hypothetical protein